MGVVLANGNMHTPEMIEKVLADTGADGVGLARGVMGRPYLFTQARQYLATGKYSQPAFGELVKIMLRQTKLMENGKGTRGIMEMRKHLGWYVHDFPGAKKLRAKLYASSTFAEVEQILLDNSDRIG
jgi:tRNA-dihydrouridine synthase